ncbi:hypothetical protein ACHQM5_026013 [Ranunculus cassubicifolius]
MMGDIIERRPFGTVVAAVCAVEFRPLTLPRAHILLFVPRSDELRQPSPTVGALSAGIGALALDFDPALRPPPCTWSLNYLTGCLPLRLLAAVPFVPLLSGLRFCVVPLLFYCSMAHLVQLFLREKKREQHHLRYFSFRQLFSIPPCC